MGRAACLRQREQRFRMHARLWQPCSTCSQQQAGRQVAHTFSWRDTTRPSCLSAPSGTSTRCLLERLPPSMLRLLRGLAGVRAPPARGEGEGEGCGAPPPTCCSPEVAGERAIGKEKTGDGPLLASLGALIFCNN